MLLPLKPVPHRERYPHTHWNHLNVVDPKALNRYISTLRSWSASLTHIIVRLGQRVEEDNGDLIEELQTLVDMLEGWIETLRDSLNNLNNQLIVLQNETVRIDDNFLDFINTLSGLISDMQTPIQSLVNSTKGLNSRITTIEEQIADIYSVLEDIVTESKSYKNLEYGTDYQLDFYNYFCPQTSGDTDVPHVSMNTTTLKTPSGNNVTDTWRIRCSSSYRLTNSETIQPGVENAGFQFAHGISDPNEAPKAWMFRITPLIKKYSSMTSSSSIGSGIWNMSPTSARASWEVTVSRYWDNDSILFLGVSIADGYNSQYYSRYDTELTYGLLNTNSEVIFNYTE